MFVKEERYIPKIEGPQKLRLGKSIFQTLVVFSLYRRWLVFLFTLFIGSVISFAD